MGHGTHSRACALPEAAGLRRKRVRYQSSSFHIPRGPRTPLGESGRGLGTQQLRTEAGKCLPLEPLRSARQPRAWPALGNFWLSGGTPGCSPRPGQSKVCASEGTFVSSRPCRLLCQRLPAPTRWCTRHLLGRVVLATPGRALFLRRAKPPSGVPPDRLDPPLQPPLQRLFPPSSLPSLCLQTCCDFCQEALSPWQTYTPPCKQDQTFWELFAGFLGVCLPGPGSGHPSLQEQGWQSARGLGPAGGCPAAGGHWLLPGREATLQSCASPGTLGSGAPPASGRSHRPGVYHRGSIISPTGQC